MHRRDFIKHTAAALALSGTPAYAEQLADTRKRVGLIGCGWYGKSDLLRLIQVAPVDVVSLCDVDKTMVAEAAEIVSTRQASKKKPRTYGDYREMLKEKDLDLVLIVTPDHWHALPMIEAVRGGLDVWVQKPISVDVVEGQAMLAAARKYKRVVQVGMQRRSTPHLVDARDRVIREGKLGTIGLVEIYCYYHMRATDEPARHRAAAEPRLRDVDRAGADAARTTSWCIRAAGARSWNTATASSATCACTCSTWCAGCSTSACRRASAPSGGILVDKKSKANITDTQTATFDFPNLKVVWTHRSYGDPPDPKYPWGATFYGDKGTLKASVMSYDFMPSGKGEPAHPRRRHLRIRAVPRGQDREGPRDARRAGDPRAT